VLPGIKSLLTTTRSALQRLTQGGSHEESENRHAIAQTRRYWDEGAALTLVDIVREGETKASGKVQYISLNDFRTSVGDLWNQYQDHILLIAETTIARMLGRGRLFIPVPKAADQPPGTDTWLLLMPDLDPDAAAEHAEAIARRLGEKLLGERFTEHAPAMPTAAQLDLTGVMSADGSLNLDALRSAVNRARTAQAAVVATAATPVTATSQSSTVMIRPAWRTATEMEDSYFLRPISARGEDVTADPAVPFPEAAAIAACSTAARLLDTISRTNLRAMIALPLPYPLLYSPAAQNLRKAIDRMPSKLRLLHLRVEIVRTPPQVLADQLVGLREIFRSAVRDVAFSVDAFAPHSDVFALKHISIGTDLSCARSWDETDLRKALGQLRADAAGRHTYVLGLRSSAHARIAVSCGIDEIGGISISKDITSLPGQLRVIPQTAIIAP